MRDNTSLLADSRCISTTPTVNPAKRTVALILAERLLDDAENLTDEQWLQLCLVMQYGGKTRLT